MKKLLPILFVLLLFPSVAFGTTRYVDGSLSEACSTYRVTERDCSGGSTVYAYKSFVAAEIACSSGDTIIVRGPKTGFVHYNEGSSTNIVINTPNTTWQAMTGEYPVIDGEHLRPDGPDDNDYWEPLVQITASGVIWDGIKVTRSIGYNMEVKGTAVAKLTGIVIRNSEISDSQHQNLVINYTTGMQIEHCEFILGITEAYNDKFPEGASVTFKYSDGLIFRYNIVRQASREGLIPDVGSSNGLIEYNQLYGNRVAQLYCCNSSGMTIRYNLIYGWADPEHELVDSSYYNAGNGINMGSETQWNEEATASGNHLVYGNLIAGCNKNISLMGEAGVTEGLMIHDCKMYNNTIVEAQTYANPAEKTSYPRGLSIPSNVGTGHEFKNNIVWQTKNDPNTAIAEVASGKCTFANNYWSQAPDTDAQSATDYKINSNYPTDENRVQILTGPAVGSGFTFADMTDQDEVMGYFTGQEFKLVAGAGVIGQGTNLGSSYDDGLDLKTVDFKTDTFNLHDRDDYNSGSWSTGADVPVEMSTPAPPDTPGTFSCAVNDAQKITCSWAASALATSYEIDYSEKSGDCATGGTAITGIITTSQYVEGLDPGQQYCFYVRARNSDGASAYTAAQTPTTTAFAWDLMDHSFKAPVIAMAGAGTDGWVVTTPGTTSATASTDGLTIEDDDGYTAPTDNRATMSRTLSQLPLDTTNKIKLKIVEAPGYSLSAPRKSIVISWTNGVRRQIIRFANDGIRVRMLGGSDSKLDGSDAYIDEAGSFHTYLFQDDAGSLKIWRDGELKYTVSGAGETTTSEGVLNIEVGGTADDQAEAIVESWQIGSGIGDDSDPPPVEPTGTYILKLE